MHRIRLVLFVILVLQLAHQAFAVQPDEVLPDAALELRARALSSQLRCMVCQNQSIDDSDAELARDLRILVRERLLKGESDRQVLAYLVSRYGEFVLLKPQYSARNMVLWASPLAILLIAAFGFYSSRRRFKSDPVVLTEEENRRLEKLLADPE